MSSQPEAIKIWGPQWTAFRQQHSRWLGRHDKSVSVLHRSTEVLYRLPATIRETLAMGAPHGRPILAPADIAAEKEFDALLVGFFAEGVYQDQPVSYRPLRPPPPLPSERSLKQIGLKTKTKQVAKATALLDDFQLRNKGYVGRLVTDPSFLRARDALRAVWLALSEYERPCLPLRTTMHFGSVSKGVADFQALLEVFCDRYGLQGMATWELPEPLEPLLSGNTWPPHIINCRKVLIALPSHFQVMDKDELIELIRDLQKTEIQAAGLDPTCVAPRSTESYAHLLEIDHYERVVIGRYGQAPRPKGFMTQLGKALTAHLDIGADHFRSLHNALAAFKRGEPHTAKWRH
jgi:hypothetical protein